LSLPAAAEERAPNATPAKGALSFACDAHAACRITTALLSRLVDAGRTEVARAGEHYKALAALATAVKTPEDAAFDARLERYRIFQEFNRKLAEQRAVREAPEEATFEAKVERYRKFQDFNRKLADERARREEEEFEAKVALIRRKVSFMKHLEEQRHSAQFEDAPDDSAHEWLYRRQ
jgi:hypothetical protein